MSSGTPVIDYEGSRYRTDFWVDQGREYEDAVERAVLQRLLPSSGRRLVEVGAGFGRLASLYGGYDRVFLFDYSRSLLEEAVRQWGHDPRFVFVAGNLYELPLAKGVIDTVVMVRVMHHLADVPSALQQLNRVLHSNSCAILEYANKRNLKAVLRWVLGKQEWSPFALSPYEFVELNYDFHPVWIEKQICEAGFTTQQILAVSHFRLGGLKKLLPSKLLAQLDNLIALPGGYFPLSPSVFVKARSQNLDEPKLLDREDESLSGLFCCPACGLESLLLKGDSALVCTDCSISYRRKGNIWDFKEGERI